jgi:hypothetical protein
VSSRIEKYSWAIPDKRAIRIAASFGPLVEVGAGKGYWAMLLRAAGVNVLAYDIIGTPAKGKGEKHGAVTFWSEVQRGGAKALQSVACLGRALFLCYPDEYEVQNTSLGLDCLTRFSGGESVDSPPTTHTHTQIHRVIDSQTLAITHLPTHTYSQPPTYTHTHIYVHTKTPTLTITFTPTHTNSLSHTRSLTHTRTHTLPMYRLNHYVV